MQDATVKELQQFCKRLAYRKLRFIADNDHSVDLEDLSCELVSHAFSAVGRYTTENEQHALNIAKKASRNHAIRIIEHYTAKKRSRVVSTQEGYASTTLSLDLIEENGVTPERLQNEYNAEQAEVDSSIERKVDHLPYPVSRIVKIVLGEGDGEFESWLAKNNHSDDEKAIAERACEYYNMPIEGLKQVLQVWNSDLQ